MVRVVAQLIFYARNYWQYQIKTVLNGATAMISTDRDLAYFH